MPSQGSQTNATSVTVELGIAVSLAPEDRRGRVYVEMPTSGVTPAPPRIYGSELRGGQALAAIVVWDQTAAQAAKLHAGGDGVLDGLEDGLDDGSDGGGDGGSFEPPPIGGGGLLSAGADDDM